jgi:hypothetical protein
MPVSDSADQNGDRVWLDIIYEQTLSCRLHRSAVQIGDY